jgi:tetratricopeptide (TPR) repeat protein
MKEYDKALAAFERATNLNPKFVDAYLNIGNLFGQTGRHEEAQSSFEKALALNPRLPRAWSGLGIVLRKRAQFEKALVAFDKALALEPNLVEAWLGCGNVFHDLRRSDEAFAAYDKALSIEPESAEIYTSRGIALHVLMRNEEALWSLNRAIELDFSSALAHFNRSLVLLTLGQYADAWDEYEWRKKLPVPLGNRIFSQPLLERAEIEGATVFVYGEQALGDQIHFCRYVNSLADRGAKVILEAPKLLFQLFKSLDGVSQLVEADQSIPPFDYHCPVMSLPRVFRTTFENIPNKVPYLFADPVKAKVWADKLGAQSRLRIGLVWSGGFRPNQPEVLSTNEKRNIPLAKFAQLKDIDAAFYSLQKGDRAVSELKELARGGWGGPDIIDLTDELNDFSDTAALIENLNLVISVDTSTAHLAGAMAKPVCLLSRFDTDWRWLSNSPWYPTVKPYIQTKAGNWDQVIENLKADLIKINQTRGYS